MTAKRIIIATAIIVSMFTAEAQVSGPKKTEEVPAVVSKAFATTYPHVHDFTWYKTSDGYRAVFHGTGNAEIYIGYNATGKKLNTGREIPIGSLPYTTRAYLNDSHPNAQNLKAYLQTRTDGTRWYEVIIGNQWFLFDGKGKQVPIK